MNRFVPVVVFENYGYRGWRQIFQLFRQELKQQWRVRADLRSARRSARFFIGARLCSHWSESAVYSFNWTLSEGGVWGGGGGGTTSSAATDNTMNEFNSLRNEYKIANNIKSIQIQQIINLLYLIR